MVAIYHPGVVTIVPNYNIGRPNPAANVLQWQTSVTGLTVGQLTSIQGAFDAAWGPGWQVIANTQYSYIGCSVIDNSSNTGQAVHPSSYTPLHGTGAGGAMGDNVAYLISLKGQNRYKGGHSRLYIPGCDLNLSNHDGQSIPAGTINSLNTLYNNVFVAMQGLSAANGGPLAPIIWHKKLKSAPNSTELIITWKGQSQLATQRRRLRKVARH